MRISEKTFLVSGGASGLGLATATMIVENGGNAILADINEDAGANAQSALGANAIFVRTDVTSEESVQNAISKGIAKFGQLNGAISCAGIGSGEKTYGSKGVHRLSTFQKVISVNLIGTFNVIRLSAEAISKNEPGESGERGVIINTASVAAFDGQIGQAAYSAKASLGSQVPFPSRLGQPKEFAQLTQQMIENQMLNGEVIRLDGAIRMAPR